MTHSSGKPYAHMVCERWLHARLDDLRARNILDQRNDLEHMPQKVGKNFLDFNVNEKNIRGETLIMSVIRYEPDKASQVRYINLLIRSGCNPSEPDDRQLRTPLMLSCMMRNETVAHHLILQNVNLLATDRMGNTALMYAALYSQSTLLNLLTEHLARRWCIEAFRNKNFMQYTAEGLARKNERYMHSMMLKKERLRIVKRLREQVASNLMFAPPFDSWKLYASVYKAKRKFLSQLHREGDEPKSADQMASTAKPLKLYLPALKVQIESLNDFDNFLDLLASHTFKVVRNPKYSADNEIRQRQLISNKSKVKPDLHKSRSEGNIPNTETNLPRLQTNSSQTQKCRPDNAAAS